jgi:hypothetical protein
MTPTDVIDLLRAGEFIRIRDMFAPQLRPLVPAEGIRTAWTAALTEHGALTGVGTPSTEQGVTRIPLTFEHGRQTLVLLMDDAGQLGGLRLAPASAAQPVAAWQQQSYVDSSLFGEEETSRGAWPAAAWRYCVSRRSRTPTRER